MSKEFRDLLTDIVSIVDPFRDEITLIQLKRNADNDIVGIAKSRSGGTSIRMMCRADVPDFEGGAVLGSIPYLSAVLNSKFIKGKADFTLEPHYEMSTNGKTRSLRFIAFTGSNKLEASYEATDPFINQMNKANVPTISDWPVTFDINQEFIKDFSDIVKIHRAAPKIGGDRDDIFTMGYNDGKVFSMFGEKGHQSTMTLSDTAVGDGKLSGLLSVTNFQAILKLIGKGEGKGKLAAKAIRIDTTTDLATYSIMLLTKKKSL